MFGLFGSILGFIRPRRSESEEPKSKLKDNKKCEDKKAPSLGSKDKNIQTQQKRRQSPNTFFEMDEVGTVKRSLCTISRDINAQGRPNFDMVSDLADDRSSSEYSDLLNSDPKDKPHSMASLPPELECLETNSMIKEETMTFGAENKQSPQLLTGSKHRTIQLPGERRQEGEKDRLRCGKVLVPRVLPMKKAVKVGNQCPFCSKPLLDMQDSLRLACSHRFHQKCAMTMRLRNRFQCDLCEVKRQNVCSVVLLDRRRQSRASPFRNP